MTSGEKLVWLLTQQIYNREHQTVEDVLAEVGVVFDKLNAFLQTDSGPEDSPRRLVQTLLQGGANLNELVEAYAALKAKAGLTALKITHG